MRQDQLPDGVPASNDEKPADTSASFAAPDMATPRFAQGSAQDELRKTINAFNTQQAVDGGIKASHSQPKSAARRRLYVGRQTILFAALLALLGALGLGLLLSDGNQAPLCSEQPSWNQYNCRAF